MPAPGDKIPLSFQSPEDNSGLFIRATIRDSLDVELIGSPKSLAHVDKGLYTDNSLDFPDSPAVKVTYQVFKDAGFTKPDKKFSLGFDIFERTLDSLILAGITKPQLSGTIKTDESLTGKISKAPKLKGVIREDRIGGTVSDPSISGVIREDRLTGEL